MAMRASAGALLVLVVAANGAAVANQDSVIQKVVEMLEDNKAKVAKDLAAEEAEMAEYSEFCDDEATAKAYSIKDSARKIADLGADIEDAEAQIKALDSEVAALGTEMAGKEKDLAASEKARKTEKEDFGSTEKTLMASVEQLEKALEMIKRQEKEKATGFMQSGKKPDQKAFAKALLKTLGSVIDAAWVSGESSKVLKGFIQQQQTAGDKAQDEDLSLASHRAKAKQEPEKKEGGITQTLEDMKTKAEETLSNTRLEEMKAEHNYQMVKQSLSSAIALMQGKINEAQTSKASLGEASGKSKAALSEAKTAKVADQEYLKSLTADCEEAAEEWAERQKEAKAEMEAIEKAKQILAEKVKVLVQKGNDYFDSDDDTADQTPVRKRLVAHLKDLSHKFKSFAFAEMASAAAADPFEKVRGIVQDMIAKLENEAAEEATQKTFCDEEKAKSLKEKDAKSSRADELANRLETAKTSKATLTEAIKDLQAQIAEIDKATQEATKMRSEEMATYTKDSKDYKDAAEAVTEAISVLKEYYSGASLAQVGKGRKNQGDAGASIIAILENSGEEFTRMYMQVETDEKEAASAYEKTMSESKVSRAAKEAQAKGAESEIKSLEVAIAESSEDYKMASKELDAVMEYLEKLKPQCETKVLTYEEKAAKRQQEIEGLKEALSILDAPALVQTRKHQ